MSSTQISDAQIAETAFYLWLEDGKPEGRDEYHWHRARAILEDTASVPAKPKRRAAPRTKAADAVTAAVTAPDAAIGAETAPKAAKPRAAKPRATKAKAPKA